MLLPILSPLLVWGEQRMHWQRMKHDLIWANLTTIEVPQHQLHWVRAGKEISWKGHHFDVKQMHLQANGCYRISGVYDYAEASIKQKAHLMASRAAEQRQQQCLHASLLLWVSTPPVAWCCPSPVLPLAMKAPAAGTEALYYIFQKVATPPPLMA